MEKFLTEFYNSVDMVSKEKKTCVMMGDFNINLINYESQPLTEDFINTLKSYSFWPLFTQPTRIIYHSVTLIDNIFINSLDYYNLSGNITTDLTDHLPNFSVFSKLSHMSRKP